MKKGLQFLVILFVVFSVASCSADEMYGTPENSVQLNDSGDPKDPLWDKTKHSDDPNP